MALSDNIETAASKPAEMEADGRKAKAHPLPDSIAVDQYIAAKAGAASPSRGLRLTRVRKGGHTDRTTQGEV